MARGPRGGRCKSLAYADRILVRCAGELMAEHSRLFGRDRTIYDPWHYLPVLAKKPDALCNGEPFEDRVLPPGFDRFRRKLGRGDPAALAKARGDLGGEADRRLRSARPRSGGSGGWRGIGGEHRERRRRPQHPGAVP